MEEKDKKIDGLIRDLNHSNQLNKNYFRNIQIQKNEIKQLNQDLNQLNENSKENIKQLIDKHKQEKNTLELKISKQQNEIQDLNKNHQEQQKKLQQKIDSLSDSNRQIMQNLENEQLQAKKYQIQIGQQTIKLNDQEKDINDRQTIFENQEKKQNDNINKLNQDVEILKLNIDFLVKIKQNIRVQQIIPLIQLIQRDVYDQENQIAVDPFQNDQLMLQPEEYCNLKVQLTNQTLENIAQNGYPPNFDKIVDIQLDSHVVMVKSIHPNQKSSFFNGYFIQENSDQLNKHLFIVKEEDAIRQPYEISDAKQQIGYRLLLEFFIQKFNQSLDKSNLGYPQLKLPKYQSIRKKTSDQYYYIEEIDNKEGLINNNQKHKLYTDSLKYFSYCCSKSFYMITDIHIYGNVIYDVIISSKYGILSLFDQGNEEIMNQSFNLDPARYNYNIYTQFMKSLDY